MRTHITDDFYMYGKCKSRKIKCIVKDSNFENIPIHKPINYAGEAYITSDKERENEEAKFYYEQKANKEKESS